MIKKTILLLLTFTFFSMASCGTILKQHQVNKPNSGKLDTTIVILDSLGLLLFLVPGIVAFTLDYSNGTLFLPRGGRS